MIWFQLIAIGPTTAEAIANEQLKLFNVCLRPTPEDLLTVIQLDVPIKYE